VGPTATWRRRNLPTKPPMVKKWTVWRGEWPNITVFKKNNITVFGVWRSKSNFANSLLVKNRLVPISYHIIAKLLSSMLSKDLHR
jgi:hypothetical protein